jgi:SNF family Na+-dependent transporter
MARADVLTVILRTAIAILAVGIPVYVLNFLIGRYYVKATLEKMEQTLLENRQREIQSRETEELQSEMDRQA